MVSARNCHLDGAQSLDHACAIMGLDHISQPAEQAEPAAPFARASSSKTNGLAFISPFLLRPKFPRKTALNPPNKHHISCDGGASKGHWKECNPGRPPGPAKPLGGALEVVMTYERNDEIEDFEGDAAQSAGLAYITQIGLDEAAKLGAIRTESSCRRTPSSMRCISPTAAPWPSWTTGPRPTALRCRTI